MKKILVFSDLHIPSRLKAFSYEKIKSYIKDIDIIFGLGDYDTQSGLNDLYSFGKDVYAVYGNMDSDDIKNNLSEKIELNIEGFNIGLIHGWGAPWGLREKLLKQFDKNINLICYGHTHSSFFDKQNNVYFFNPGALCGEFPSFGVITLGKSIKTMNESKVDSKIEVKIIDIKE